jgi:hypothetical protein
MDDFAPCSMHYAFPAIGSTAPKNARLLFLTGGHFESSIEHGVFNPSLVPNKIHHV